MKFVPHPYQDRLIRFVQSEPRCGVFAGMGLGKSVTTLTALANLALVEDVFPALVLAPKRVARETWPDEVRKWDHLRHLRIAAAIGTPAQRTAALKSGADIVTINYDNVPWLIDAVSDAWPFRTVVADESTRLKSFRLKQGGVRAQRLNRVAHHTARWVNLTGTPAPNGLKDLWGQTYFLDRGARLGHSYTAFKDRWFYVDRDGYSLVPHAHSEEQIRERIADICVSLTASDYLKLPPLIEREIVIDLPLDARRVYRGVERDLWAVLKTGEIRADMALTKTLKCLQITSGAPYLTPEDVDVPKGRYEVIHDEKIDAVESVVEEASGAPVLVAYHFRSELDRLRGRFGKQLRTLDGDGVVADWNAGRIPILAVHPTSAGHGLNLQHGGNILVFLTSWWNLEEHLQVIERIGPTRQAQAGLNRPVFVYRIVARDTLDEAVLERLRGKIDAQDALMNALRLRHE